MKRTLNNLIHTCSKKYRSSSLCFLLPVIHNIMCNNVMMNKISKIATFITLLFVITACSPNNMVKAREQFWRQKVEQFNPVGKTRAELFEWQKNNNVPLNSFPDKNGIILETIEGDGLVCSKWNLYLSVDAYNKGIITSYSVTSAGVCL